MPNKMLIDATHPEETRVVVVDGSKVEEFDFESENKRQLAGNIYLAKVTRVEPSLQAAFVDYGGNRHGFLAFSEIHPDYYQIPVADREALMAEERAYAQSLQDDEGDEDGASAKPKRTRSRRSKEPRAPETSTDETPAPQDASASIAGMDVVDLAEPADPGTGLVEAFDATPDPVAPAADAVESAPEMTQAEPAQADDSSPEEPPVAPAPEPEVQQASSEGVETAPANPAPETAQPAPLTPSEASEPTTSTDEAPSQDGEGGEDPDNDPRPSGGSIAATERLGAEDAVTTSDEPEVASTEAEPEAADAEASPPAAAEPEGEAEDAGPPVTEAPQDMPLDDSIEAVADDDTPDEIRPPRKPRPRRYKIQEVIKRRQIMLVQVVKEERGNKGAALTTYLSLAGRYCVLMPNTARGGGISRKITNADDRKRLKDAAGSLEVADSMGLIIRTAGAQRTKSEIKRDFEYLLRLWENVRDLTLRSSAPTLVYEEGNLVKRCIRDLYSKDIDAILVEGDESYKEAKAFMRMLMPSHAKHVQQYKDRIPLFQRYQVETHLDSMFSPTVELPSGGYLVINSTEALVAIDVNSGRSTREHNIEDTALKTNCEAAEEIARQLRLRDLAGLIVIDFIDMEETRNNRTVEKKLKDCLKSDRARIQIGRISMFGLLEMSRQRLRAGVLEGSTQTCPHCEGSGKMRSVESAALRVLRACEEEGVRERYESIIVRVPSEVALYVLNHKRRQLMEIDTRYALEVIIETDNSLYASDFAIDRGEPLSDERRARIADTAISMETAYNAPIVDDPADVEDDDTEETDEADEPDQRASDGDDDSDADDGKRKRRRGGRRRRGDKRGDDESTGKADAQSASDANDDDDDADGVSADAASDDDDEDGDKPKRRRRRGKRGGRRNKRTEDGDTPAAAPTAEGDQPPMAAWNVSDEIDTTPKQDDRPRRDESKPDEAAALETAEPMKPDEIDTDPALDHPLPNGSAAHPTPGTDIDDETDETGSALSAQSDPAPRSDPEPDRPAKRGWWQRKLFSL